ncbi:MAG: lysylphosphatidylglycerol synthase transmembrane domain-containing protein [Ginsengibacter sp.]
MSKKLFTILKYIFFLGIGFFLVWWQFDKMTAMQKAQFSESLRNANYWLVLPVIAMAILSHISRSVRWKILIEPMGYDPSTKNAFYSVMSGYLANTFVPRAGEILKCSLLSRYEKIPMNKLIGTILIERVFDLICYLVLIAITILIQLNKVSFFAKEKFSEMASTSRVFPVWLKLITAVTIIICLIFFMKWILKKFAHHRYIIHLRGFHIGLREGLNSIRYLKNKSWFLAHTLFIWVMYLMQIYVGFSALSATEHLGIAQACSVLSLATLGMIVSPGGIGAFPLAVQEVLLIYDIDNVSFGWLMWGVSTAIIIVAGLFSLLLLIYKKDKKPDEAKPADNV